MASEEKTKSRRSTQRAAVQSQPRRNVAVAQAKEPPIESAWHERAAFQVAFDHSVGSDGQMIWQTRVYHEEADGRAIWPGIAGEPLMAWMRERADLPAESPIASPAEAPADQQPQAEPPTEVPAAEASPALILTIDELSLEAIPAEQQVGGAPTEPRLDARIGFRLSGVGAFLATANESPCLVQVLAHDIALNHIAIVALEGQQLQPELLEYSISISFEPPPVGEYQIMALVLLPDQAVSATELGPSLTVVP